MIGLTAVFVVGAILVAIGFLAIVRGRSAAATLVGAPLVLGGAAVDLVGVSRGWGPVADRTGGQALAVLALLLVLAYAGAGALLAPRNEREDPR